MWICVCHECGARGGSNVNSKSRPSYSPSANGMGGKCKNTADGKHRPVWKQV